MKRGFSLVLLFILLGTGVFIYSKYLKNGFPVSTFTPEVTIKGHIAKIDQDLDLVKTLSSEEMVAVRENEEFNRKNAI